MLLDLDQGSMAIWKNGEPLGVMQTVLQCMLMEVCSSLRTKVSVVGLVHSHYTTQPVQWSLFSHNTASAPQQLGKRHITRHSS